MPPKQSALETCQVCKKTLKIVNGAEMRLHLLSDHEQKVADVLDSEKVKSSPELQWIKEYISAATEMMQFAQNNHNHKNNNGTRKRPAARDRKSLGDSSVAAPPVASTLRRSIRTSRSGSRELSTPPATKTVTPQSVSRESSMERAAFGSGDKNGSTCRECGAEGIKRGLEVRHVLQSHLNIPAFTCSQCDYVNTYNRDSALKHAQRMHSAKTTDSSIVDNTGEHEAVISDMTSKCFPKEASASRTPAAAAAAVSERGRRQSSASDTVPPKSSARKACGLCGKQLTTDEFLNHAWNEHRRMCRRVYRCSMCVYSTVENRHRVQMHISKEHDNDPDAAVIRDEDAEFRKLVEQCFGKEASETAGMKGVRGDSGGMETLEPAPKREATTIESMAIESTVDCRLCDTTLPLNHTVLQQHVFRVHADRPLFLCSDCPFSNSYRPWPVRQHIKNNQLDGTHHQATVIDYSHLFLPEICRISTDCFPGAIALFQ